jgi:pimeloyl-ACP methyl ester carboxylesterase
VRLCYETFGDPADAPLLLIMGLGTQMIAWPDQFCRDIAASGFHVIRFDNRDCGRSSRMSGKPPSMTELVLQRVSNPPYGLSDMAADAAGLLRELGVDSAHIVGASMGGMIAQTMAIEYPEKVRSLVSIMSTTGDRFKGRPAFAILRYLLRRAPTEREAYLDYMLEMFDAIGSPELYRDPARLRATAERSYERGLNPGGTGRQLGAIIASGDRTRRLHKVTAPTLVIHGTRDPLVNPSGGRATAQAIPRARLIMVEGMGHDLPDEAWPRLIDAVVGHAHEHAGSAPQAQAPDRLAG